MPPMFPAPVMKASCPPVVVGRVGRRMSAVNAAGSGAGDDVHRRRGVLLCGPAVVAIAAGGGMAKSAEAGEDARPRAWALTLPESWEEAAGIANAPSATRRVTVFYPRDASAADVNVSVIVTKTSPEFTKMGAFGSPTDFAMQNVVAPLDRAYLCRANRPGTPCYEPSAKLVNASDNNGVYQVIYEVSKPGEDGFERTFYSAVGVGSDGVSQALFTLTAQVPTASKADYEKELQDIAKSFRLLR